MHALTDTPHRTDLLALIAGCWVSQAISLAARLGIADLLQAGPMHYTALAAATKSDASMLYRVLRSLASLGVFAEDAQGLFRLTLRAEPLRTDAPGSLRAFAAMIGEPEHWRAWEGLLHGVKNGEPPFQHVFGAPFFDYLRHRPEAARRFDDAMTSRSAAENVAIVAAYDFSRADIIVDVGGGQGSLMASILKKHARPRGVLLDLLHVIEGRTGRLADSAFGHRCEAVPGDFFSAVTPRGDIYVLKKIIHDWDDERAGLILENCRRAMSASSRLLVIEPVVPGVNEPSFSKLLDLLMLVWHTGGRERTASEHERLLVSAGFRVERIVPTPCGLSIIEAVPASAGGRFEQLTSL
jgi:hypothetical protein